MLLFEKLLLILKKKDAKHYTYKGHILVSTHPSHPPLSYHHSGFSTTFPWPLHPTYLNFPLLSFLSLSLSLHPFLSLHSLNTSSLLPPLHSRFPTPLHILSQRDELNLADDTHSGGSHVFKVFSQHHRSQSYAIHTNTTLAKQEWVGKIRKLKEEESFEQVVSLHTVRVHTKPLADGLAPFGECRRAFGCGEFS